MHVCSPNSPLVQRRLACDSSNRACSTVSLVTQTWSSGRVSRQRKPRAQPSGGGVGVGSAVGEGVGSSLGGSLGGWLAWLGTSSDGGATLAPLGWTLGGAVTWPMPALADGSSPPGGRTPSAKPAMASTAPPPAIAAAVGSQLGKRAVWTSAAV